MLHTVTYLLRPSLIPELRPDIPTGTTRNGHLGLVAIAAVRAFPDQLSAVICYDSDFTVIAATFTVIALGVQFCIHNVIVDMLHDRKDCRNILLHVRHFHVTDRAARRKLLKL